jgi:hypothetical protein
MHTGGPSTYRIGSGFWLFRAGVSTAEHSSTPTDTPKLYPLWGPTRDLFAQRAQKHDA